MSGWFRCLAKVLHFEILCRATGYDPSLLAFRRFFRLAKNGDWFTFETSQVDTCLIKSMVTTLGSWKDRFFWVSESIIPFKMIWRHPNAVFNELKPSDSELDSWFLKSIRACPSRLRPFPEPLLVLMGISKLWDKPDPDPVLMRDGQAPLFQEDSRHVKPWSCLLWTLSRVMIHQMLCLLMLPLLRVRMLQLEVPTSKQSTHLSTRRKGVGQPSSSETIDFGDDLEVEDTEVPANGKKGELPLVVGKDTKEFGKKVGGLKSSGKTIESSSNIDSGKIYVPNWKVTVSDNFKSPAVCEDVLNHFAPPAIRASSSSSSMVDDQMISKMVMASCNLCALLPDGIAHFRKRMQEYEVF
ncbi:hypothetical protein Hdeb2414_s0009g00321791 [Helianthus debilis subsp. tardiflorus]